MSKHASRYKSLTKKLKLGTEGYKFGHYVKSIHSHEGSNLRKSHAFFPPSRQLLLLRMA